MVRARVVLVGVLVVGVAGEARSEGPTPGEVKRYAEDVIRAIEFFEENYVEEIRADELARWTLEGIYERLGVRLPPKLVNRTRSATKKQLGTIFEEARRQLERPRGMSEDAFLYLTLDSMMNRLDPFTEYLRPDELAPFSHGEPTPRSIGVRVRSDGASGRLVVETPLRGSPALKAGIRAGDVIAKVTRRFGVNGEKLEEPEIISLDKLSFEAAK